MWNRLDRDTALDHSTRRTIFELVRQEPGIHFSQILAVLSTVSGHSSLGYGSLSYHLYKLERAGAIVSRRSGRHRRYYEAGSSFGDPTALSVVQRPRTGVVARLIAERREATLAEIALELAGDDVPTRQVVAYHVRLLKNAGLVKEERSGRGRTYATTPRLSLLFAASRTRACLSSLSGIPNTSRAASTDKAFTRARAVIPRPGTCPEVTLLPRAAAQPVGDGT